MSSSHIEAALVAAIKSHISTIHCKVTATETHYVGNKLQSKIFFEYDTSFDPQLVLNKVDRKLETEFPGLNFDSRVQTELDSALLVMTTVFYA